MENKHKIQVSISCDEVLYNDYLEAKNQLSEEDIVPRTLSNAETVKHMIKEYLENKNDSLTAKRKIEMIKEIIK